MWKHRMLHLLTVPSPILLMTHGTRAVDPVCAVTTVLFSVAKWTGGLSKGGNEAPSSFRISPPSARSRSAESGKNWSDKFLCEHKLLRMCYFKQLASVRIENIKLYCIYCFGVYFLIIIFLSYSSNNN